MHMWSRREGPHVIVGAGLSVQAFVGSAGDAGVLYVAMGTIATLGEAPACRPLQPPCLAGDCMAIAHQQLLLCWPQAWVIEIMSMHRALNIQDSDTAPA